MTHLATLLPSKSHPLTLHPRPTPKPGPNDLLLEIKSIALNPADVLNLDTGLLIQSYPAILGFDISGLVLETGCNVPSSFKPNLTRVAAYATSFWKSGSGEERERGLDYGAFQEKCLVPWQHAIHLGEHGKGGLSWNQAACLPVSVQVPLCAWDMMGIPRIGAGKGPGGPGKKEILLIWGASSSVGSMGVQTARLLRDDPTSSFAAVYATAGSSNKAYVESLGADRVFDHRDSGVVDQIVSAARNDGLSIRYCFLAVGELRLCQNVLKEFIRDDSQVHSMQGMGAKIASAPPIPGNAAVIDGIESIFLMPSAVEGERLEQFEYWMGTWLSENLEKGTIRPSPELTVVGKGLESINAGLDRLRQGVSCTKLVSEVAE